MKLKFIDKLDHFFVRTLSFAYTPFKKYSYNINNQTQSDYELSKKDKIIGRILGTIVYFSLPLILIHNFSMLSLIFILPSLIIFNFLVNWAAHELIHNKQKNDDKIHTNNDINENSKKTDVNLFLTSTYNKNFKK